MTDKRQILELIEQGAFRLYGQPKWTFGKSTCNTYEMFAEKVCLPEEEAVSARELIAQIELDDELTDAFSDWFLQAAMRLVVQLSDKTDSNITLSINVLPLYANKQNFVRKIRAMLKATGLRPYKLQFELSEAQRLSQIGIDNLNIMHDEEGIALLLANFGTGYSNIELLKHVHFDGLELGLSFAVDVPEHEQVCLLLAGIAHFADATDLHLCAKGIETAEQLEFFEQLGCLKGQGYLIGGPMAERELTDYIAKYAKKRKR